MNQFYTLAIMDGDKKLFFGDRWETDEAKAYRFPTWDEAHNAAFDEGLNEDEIIIELEERTDNE